ncbi:UNVERIFIED_CONTAM: hypothetical protein FKN15_050185 [Acipenser sinensis]
MDRMRPLILSEAAHWLGQIQDAMQAGKGIVHVQSSDTTLNPLGGCLAIIKSDPVKQTGNALYPRYVSPAATIPDNLLRCFRIVSITSTNLHFPVETLLFTAGFSGARLLARKLLALLEACSKMSATSAGSVHCGNAKFSEPVSLGSVENPSLTLELSSVKGALDEETEAIAKAATQRQLCADDKFISRVLRLAHLVQTYQITAIVGPAGCGKSECIRTYLQSVREKGTDMDVQTVFIRALESQQLLGWMDGLLPKLLRLYWLGLPTASKEITGTVKTVHLDGQVGWINTIFIFSAAFYFRSRLWPAMYHEYRPKFSEPVSLGSVENPSLTLELSSVKGALDEETEAIAKAATQRQLCADDKFISRVLRLAHLVQTYQITAIVGPAGCGKSECIRTYLQSVREKGTDMDVQTVFIRALESQQLLGWMDGLLPKLLRLYWLGLPTASKEITGTVKTVHLDGQIWDYYIDKETWQFVRWSDSVPLYSVPCGQGIPSQAFVHTVESEVDHHGSQPACELMRQLLDCGGGFDPLSFEWKKIKNVTFLATANVNSSARVPKPSQRLLRHYSIFHCPYPSSVNQYGIFSALLNAHFLQSPPAHQVRLIINPQQPLLSNVIELEGGLISAAPTQWQVRSLNQLSNQERLYDGYQHTFDEDLVRELLEESVREHNKTNPRMAISFYKGQRVLLVLSEEHMEMFSLLYISDLVVSRSVTPLFTSEQQTSIVNELRSEMTNEGITFTKEAAWDYFLRRVTQNLRCIFICPSTGSNFLQCCQEFPAFTNTINIYFVPHWSRSNLVAQASYHIRDLELSGKEKENVSHLLASMHLVICKHDGNRKGTGRFGHLTNGTYETFVQNFVTQLKKKHAELMEEHKEIEKMLGHIKDILKASAKLKKDFQHETVVLEEHKQGAMQILIQIGQDKTVAEQQVHALHQQMKKIRKLQKLLPEYQLAHDRVVYKCSAIVLNIKKLVGEIDTDALAAWYNHCSESLSDTREIPFPLHYQEWLGILVVGSGVLERQAHEINSSLDAYETTWGNA